MESHESCSKAIMSALVTCTKAMLWSGEEIICHAIVETINNMKDPLVNIHGGGREQRKLVWGVFMEVKKGEGRGLRWLLKKVGSGRLGGIGWRVGLESKWHKGLDG